MAKNQKKGKTGFRNGNLFCFNCGQSYQIHYPQPIDMAAVIMKQFAKEHKNCEPTWKEPEPDMSQPEWQRSQWWLIYGEHGISSKTIHQTITGKPILGLRPSHPHDPDDFSRCYK